MAYVTPEYYVETYKGVDAHADLERLLERASDIIDMATSNKLQIIPLENYPDFVQEQVKKAVCSQVEYFISMGGYETVMTGESEIGNASLGSFSYKEKNENRDRSVALISPSALQYLKSTGLLYSGIEVGGLYGY